MVDVSVKHLLAAAVLVASFSAMDRAFDAMPKAFILTGMAISQQDDTALAIARHCLQQCLHQAQQVESGGGGRSYFGLLGGEGQCFLEVLPLPASLLTDSGPPDALLARMRSFCRRYPLLACIVARTDDTDAAARIYHALICWLRRHELPTPAIYAEIEMSEKGRMEMYCRAAEDGRAIPLAMLEDGKLYQPLANH